MAVCTVCSSSFIITEDDRAFYQTMDVSPPALCPVCRFRRKAVWRNERTLYVRTCDLCAKTMVSMFPRESHFTVYCRDCYYSDRWDPLSYGMRYNAARTFFDQFHELHLKTPKSATLTSGQSVNSEYQLWAGHNKDCYMVSNSGFNEMLLYSRGMRQCRDTIDCYYGVDTELSYESINIHNSSRVRYSDNVRNCLDSWFLRDCTGCTNCFGCVNLRYKDYYFFNELLSKEEYERRVAEIVGSSERLQKMREEFTQFSMTQPYRAHHNMKSEDCSGDYIVDSKNCHACYEVDKGENCSYHYFTKTAKDAYDCIGFGYDSELLYECVAVGFSHKVMGCMYVEQCSDIEYCTSVRSSASCIGCDGVDKVQFAILNTIYPEDEYRFMRQQIIDSMKREGSWGQYFPLKLAPFAFNESIALDYYPLSKEEARGQGYRWQDELPETIGKETMLFSALPDHIRDVPDTITKEILACEACKRNYKIIAQELRLYRQLSVPIPRLCFSCRHAARLARRGPMQLMARTCTKCGKAVQTSSSHDAAPILYCEECYVAQVA
ncbi:MAG: hypothetical protein AAB855_03615 [Patescibacteria group bacterium]